MSNLFETVQVRLADAMKNRREVERDTLRCVKGEVERANKSDDPTVERVVRKLLEGNRETLGHLSNGDPRFLRLGEENTILEGLVPKSLSREELLGHLKISSDTILSDIRAARNDGQATGVVMKWFGAKKIKVLGEDVTAVVKQIRLDSGTVGG